MRSFSSHQALLVCTIFLPVTLLLAQNIDTRFHDAPESAQKMKNPYEGQNSAAQAGKPLYARDCLSCHGKLGKGTGDVPSLVDGKLSGVRPGEVFWFITRGDKDSGMPSWSQLPAKQRWQIVSYVMSALPAESAQPVAAAPAPDTTTSRFRAPRPTPPFIDFRYEKPGAVHKITVTDLPQPYATQSANNDADIVARPEHV